MLFNYCRCVCTCTVHSTLTLFIVIYMVWYGMADTWYYLILYICTNMCMYCAMHLVYMCFTCSIRFSYLCSINAFTLFVYVAYCIFFCHSILLNLYAYAHGHVHTCRSCAFLVPGFVMIFMSFIIFFFLIVGMSS